MDVNVDWGIVSFVGALALLWGAPTLVFVWAVFLRRALRLRAEYRYQLGRYRGKTMPLFVDPVDVVMEPVSWFTKTPIVIQSEPIRVKRT